MAALVAGGLLAGSVVSQAQDPTNAMSAVTNAPAAKPRGMMNAEAIEKQLALTDDQKAKADPIIKDWLQKVRDLRSDTSVAPADKRAKAKELRDAATAQLKDILTADQLAKWQKLGAGNRRPTGAMPTPATPPQQ